MASPRSNVSNDYKEETHDIQHINRPLLKDLVKELNSVVTWQLLMINMEAEKFENDKIEKNFPNDVDRQKQEAFDKWLRRKPDACWKDVIVALYKIKEDTLAFRLAKKYPCHWKDPRGSVNGSFLCTSYDALITAKKMDEIHRKFLPQLAPGLDYYIFEDKSVELMNERSAAERTTRFSRILLNVPFKVGLEARPGELLPANSTNQKWIESKSVRKAAFNTQSVAERTTRFSRVKVPCSKGLEDFFKSVEDSGIKGAFKVGLEARFGNMYWKLKPGELLPANSTNQKWIESKLVRKAAFNTQVEEADVGQLFVGREQLGKEVTKISVTFNVEGQDEGRYSAAIAAYEDGNMFCLDAVYRKQPVENRARLSIALPGRKYDLRISDCSECILLSEHQNSIPYQMALTITNTLCRLPDRKLCVILHGSLPNDDVSSSWKVEYIRQRVQRQYKWNPDKKWILARYNADVFEYDTNQDLVDTATVNEKQNIKFDYSRNEVELWDQKIYPRNVSDTHPSKDKYYYMEGIEGVRLPGGELREPYNWTTEKLLKDFEEFLGDAFKIAHILDGSPY